MNVTRRPGLIVRGLMVVKLRQSDVMGSNNIKTFFGGRVRELRKARGWSQEDFAFRVGLDRSYVGGVERGERNISLENIALIAAALEISVSELFEGWSQKSRSSARVQHQRAKDV